MFIVEGLDYAGKSTVLQRLQHIVRKQRWERWFGHKQVADIQRWGKLPSDFDYCQSYMFAAHKEQLCDRFVLSELAYGEVFRGGPHALFDSHARRRVQRELNLTGTVTLLVKAGWETTLHRAAERCLSEFDAAMKVKQTYDAGTKAFQNALNDLALGRKGGSFLGEYDSSAASECDDKAAVDDVLEFYLLQWKLHLERSREVQRACPKSWGYLWPRVLFVGENINHATSPRPFAGSDASSRTLSDLLDLAQVGEKDLYFWNAYDYNGNPLLTREGVAVLRPELVVALGQQASDYLTTLKIKHAGFPHPQWIGRFHRKEMVEWAQGLKALLTPVLRS